MLDRVDEVIFVAAGRVVATGKHRALLESDPRYRRTVTRRAGTHCSGPDGTCIADNNCSNIGVNQGLPNPAQLRGSNNGNPCNDNGTFYQKTGGGFFNCPCTQFSSVQDSRLETQERRPRSSSSSTAEQ